jgi:enoyl-CoA hydratase
METPVGSELLEIERDGELALVTLNRPDAMNALSSGLRAAIVEAFRSFQERGDVRVVILTGAGRAFCAGFDLKEMASGQSDQSALAVGNAMQEAIEAFEGPIIGAINGHAITGGFELALACDLLVASTSAVFADTHARVGILPGWGLSQRLPRRIGIVRAKEISLTGNFIDAEQANDWGLVNRVVEPDALIPTCRKLALDMLSCQPDALRGVKQLIDEGSGMPLSEAMAWENRLATESAAAMTSEGMAGSRDAVQKRGREQQ